MTKPKLHYVICTAPRTGSWMLCSLLEQTGVAGHPSEFFGPTFVEEFGSNRAVAHASDTQEYLDRVMAVSTSPNGVFGTKLTAQQTPVFLRHAAAHARRPFVSLHEALEHVFPGIRYIYLTRENKVAQAISFYKAVLNQVWQRRADENLRPTRAVAYDHFSIQRCYQNVISSDQYWNDFFKKHNVEPLRLSYEGLVADYVEETRRVLAHLDLPADTPILPPETTKLADAQSLEWEHRFRTHGRIPETEGLPAERLWAPY